MAEKKKDTSYEAMLSRAKGQWYEAALRNKSADMFRKTWAAMPVESRKRTWFTPEERRAYEYLRRVTPEAPKEDKGILGKVLNAGGRVLDVVSRPAYMVGNIAEELGDDVLEVAAKATNSKALEDYLQRYREIAQTQKDFSILDPRVGKKEGESPLDALKRGTKGWGTPLYEGVTGKDKVGFGDALTQATKAGGITTNWVNVPLSFTGNVVGDPLTYIGPGLVKGVGKGVAGVATKAGLAGKAGGRVGKFFSNPKLAENTFLAAQMGDPVLGTAAVPLLSVARKLKPVDEAVSRIYNRRSAAQGLLDEAGTVVDDVAPAVDDVTGLAETVAPVATEVQQAAPKIVERTAGPRKRPRVQVADDLQRPLTREELDAVNAAMGPSLAPDDPFNQLLTTRPVPQETSENLAEVAARVLDEEAVPGPAELERLLGESPLNLGGLQRVPLEEQAVARAAARALDDEIDELPDVAYEALGEYEDFVDPEDLARLGERGVMSYDELVDEAADLEAARIAEYYDPPEVLRDANLRRFYENQGVNEIPDIRALNRVEIARLLGNSPASIGELMLPRPIINAKQIPLPLTRPTVAAAADDPVAAVAKLVDEAPSEVTLDPVREVILPAQPTAAEFRALPAAERIKLNRTRQGTRYSNVSETGRQDIERTARFLANEESTQLREVLAPLAKSRADLDRLVDSATSKRFTAIKEELLAATEKGEVRRYVDEVMATGSAEGEVPDFLLSLDELSELKPGVLEDATNYADEVLETLEPGPSSFRQLAKSRGIDLSKGFKYPTRPERYDITGEELYNKALGPFSQNVPAPRLIDAPAPTERQLKVISEVESRTFGEMPGRTVSLSSKPNDRFKSLAEQAEYNDAKAAVREYKAALASQENVLDYFENSARTRPVANLTRTQVARTGEPVPLRGRWSYLQDIPGRPGVKRISDEDAQAIITATDEELQMVIDQIPANATLADLRAREAAKIELVQREANYLSSLRRDAREKRIAPPSGEKAYKEAAELRSELGKDTSVAGEFNPYVKYPELLPNYPKRITDTQGRFGTPERNYPYWSLKRADSPEEYDEFLRALNKPDNINPQVREPIRQKGSLKPIGPTLPVETQEMLARLFPEKVFKEEDYYDRLIREAKEEDRFGGVAQDVGETFDEDIVSIDIFDDETGEWLDEINYKPSEPSELRQQIDIAGQSRTPKWENTPLSRENEAKVAALVEKLMDEGAPAPTIRKRMLGYRAERAQEEFLESLRIRRALEGGAQ